MHRNHASWREHLDTLTAWDSPVPPARHHRRRTTSACAASRLEACDGERGWERPDSCQLLDKYLPAL